ncbi:MAG TPA: YdbL family protein [Geminicoccaceae bacterium]|nr:YdbL family protein [Geminicoccaceae bacterium]
MRLLPVLLLTALLGMAAPAAPALAAPLDDAKSAGLVGERVDGYAGVVGRDAPAEVRRLVEDINSRRRERYAEIARERNVSTEAVAAIAGQKLVTQAPRGQWVFDAEGVWKQKP